MSEVVQHPAFDAFFDKLLDLLRDADTFDADVLEEEDWKLRFSELKPALLGVNRTYAQEKRKMAWLVANLFVAEDSPRWILPEHYAQYLALWDAALGAGYIPDCVCPNGPSPTEKWVPQPVTPVKSLGKRSPNAAVPAQSFHKTFTAYMDAGITKGTAAPAQIPSSQTPSLPVLGFPASRWYAPANQAIYCLDEFVPDYAASGGKGITSAKEWRAAAIYLGQAMAADPKSHNFVWSEFMTYLEVTDILFTIHRFKTVIEYDIAWRKWRRANSESWSAFNHVLRDFYLAGGPTSSSSQPKPQQNVCFDFSRPGGGCTRLSSCQYSHKCNRCRTTFPSTIATCPCIHGVLPSGTTLPQGVTFGK
jgi:hypothetical protein